MVLVFHYHLDRDATNEDTDRSLTAKGLVSHSLPINHAGDASRIRS